MPDLLKNPARNPRERDLHDPESRSGHASAEFTAANLPGRGAFPDADANAVSREDEANMRRALGMLGGSARAPQPSGNGERRGSGHGATNSHPGGQAPRRHRFVQDGEVPVTVVRAREHAADLSRATPASPVNRLDALQESLGTEQAARANAERALEEAQATIRTLQTRLSHLELAREEALAQAQQAQADAAALAEAAAQAEMAPVVEASVVKAPVAMAAKITRGKARKQRQPTEPEPEPEPVKWWLSSQATRAPSRRSRPRAAETPE